MKVTISLFGRFHAFNQAHQLTRHGALHRLITSYPKFETQKYAIPRENITSLLPYEIFDRAWKKFIPGTIQSRIDITPAFCDHYDRICSKFIPEDTDIYIGWASKCEHGLQRAKELGAIAIVDRGSSHAIYNKQLLQEEYSLQGVQKWIPPDSAIEKELREYELADYILIPSQFVRQSFLENGVPDEKLIVIPYGVNLSSFQQEPKHDDIFRVIYVGGLHHRKGIQYLLDAYSQLELKNAELWLLGSKSKEIEPTLRKFSHHFRYFEPVPQKELFKFYSQSSLFVIASIEEGLAMVIPQAMACGLPVICTTNTGGADIVQNGVSGFIVPIRDITALKEKINWFYANRERCHEMGENAKKFVANYGTWDDYGDSLMKNLESLL